MNREAWEKAFWDWYNDPNHQSEPIEASEEWMAACEWMNISLKAHEVSRKILEEAIKDRSLKLGTAIEALEVAYKTLKHLRLSGDAGFYEPCVAEIKAEEALEKIK